LKVVVNALFASVPAMTNLLMVVGLILVIFAIMGVNFFKGAFYYCKTSIPDLPISTKADCYNFGGNWVNA
jgi:hypothetical protein